MHLSTDHLIVYAFLLLTLLVGLWAGRGIKDIKEYAIANKMYGTGILTTTFLATYFGGYNAIGYQKYMLSYGLVAALAGFGTIVTMVWFGRYVVPKLMYFKDSLTLGDMMQELYGAHGGIIAGLIGAVYSICQVGTQLVAMGYICESMLGWPASQSIGIGGAILVAYASFGGVKSVTITDVLQFIVFVIVIPLIANLAISEVGGIKALLSQVPADKLTVVAHEQFPRYLVFFFVWGIFPASLSSPPIVQRLLMAKHKHQAANMLYVSAAFLFFVRVLVALTCLAVVLLAPSLQPSAGGAFIYVIEQYLSPAVKGLCVAGLLAIIMSTFDSFLNAGSLLFTRNVLKPSCARLNVAFDELKVVRYIGCLIGSIAILTALGVLDFEVRSLNFFATSLFAPVITIPLVAGILGLKPDTRSFLIASSVTVVTFCLAHLSLPASSSYLAFPISIVANATSFLGMHLLRNKGIVVVHRNAGEDLLAQKYSYKNIRQQLSKVLDLPQHIRHYFQTQLAAYEKYSLPFALFVCFNNMVPYFMYTRQGEGTMFVVKLIGVVLCVGLLFKPYWNAWLTKYFYYYWAFCLLYCLPFTTSVLYILNDGGTEWTVNVALSILLLVLLIDWQGFIILLFTGTGLGILYTMPVTLTYENNYALVYTCLFSTLIGLLFARRRQRSFAKTTKQLAGKEAASQRLAQDMVEERDKTLRAITGTEDLLIATRKLLEVKVDSGEAFEKLSDITTKIIPIAFQLHGLRARAQDYLRLKIDAVATRQLLVTAQEALRDSGIDTRIDYHGHTQHEELVCDEEQLLQLLLRGMTALSEIAEEGTSIMLSVEDTQLIYPMPDVVIGYEKKVQALRIGLTTKAYLPKLAASYAPDLTSNTEQGPLATRTNRRIVKAHYGYMEETADTLLYVVPADVKEVRPRDMDKAYMEVGSTLTKANDKYKGKGLDAEAQEQALLAAVKARSDASLGKVILAIELIKWLHGPVNRKSGEPFYLHPLAVAQIVLEYSTAEATILGALLHDTVEDTAALLGSLGAIFGRETADVVDVVTHLQSYRGSFYKVKLSANENLQMLVETENKEALYVKVADRMHNVRTIEGHDSLAKQQRIASETLEFFVPLSKGLGLSKAAEEFEERCKAVLRKKA